jgi:hypothetical protein
LTTILPFTPKIDMPFADMTKDQIDWWVVTETGDRSADNDLGREYARLLIRYIRANQTPFLMGYVMKAIAEKGRISGVEIGFFQGIGHGLL